MENTLDKPAVAAIYIKAMVDILKEKGFPPQQLLQKAEIDESLINSSDTYITLVQYQTALSFVQEILKEPALGLYLGKRLNMGMHGLLLHAVISRATVEKALELGTTLFKMRCLFVNLDMKIEGEDVSISFDTPFFIEDQYRAVIEVGLFVYYEFLNFYFDNQLPPMTIQLRYPKPTYVALYRKYFKVPCAFDCERNEIRLPRKSIQKSLRSADPVLAQKFKEQCEQELLAMTGLTLTEKIIEVLLKNPGFFPNQTELAVLLNISPRTLRRQLNQANTSYQQILNQARKDIACQYLLSGRWSIGEIAHLLGYSNTHNFSSAFKKWTGSPPNQYRKQSTQTIL